MSRHRLPTRRPDPRERGFTLVEVLVTIAVIAVLATVAVPNYLSSRATANESAAVATLRSIATAQTAFRNAAAIDRDRDGAGEHGTLRELTGAAALFGSDQLLQPHLLPPSLAGVDGAGRTLKSGYWFALHLPAADGLGLAETTANRGLVDQDLAEVHWTCLAWPMRQGASGVHTYFVNEQGEVRKNRTQRYSGTNRVPPAGAALVGAASPEHVIGTRVATDEMGADGGVWMSVR